MNKRHRAASQNYLSPPHPRDGDEDRLNVRYAKLLKRWLGLGSLGGRPASVSLIEDTRAALRGARDSDYAPNTPWVCGGPPPCPKCGSTMELKTNTYTLAKFWGCDWPRCWGARDFPDASKDRGRPIPESPRYVEGVLIGGPGDGRRLSTLDGVSRLDLPVERACCVVDVGQPSYDRASYRKQFWPNGAWAWV